MKSVVPVRPPPVVRPPPGDGRPKNRLLLALPPEEFRRLLPDLKTIPMRVKQVLQKSGEPLRYVYFPNGGVASVTTLLTGGAMVETATVGPEGMLGIEAFFGDEVIASGETLIQVPDTDMERLSVRAFRRELGERGALHDVVGRYAQCLLAQTMQSTACNAMHHVHERCCRWLLQTHDRMGQQDFQLSHEFLGVMLGVRRQTVTVVAGTLQKAGLIRYIHGRVTILARKEMEAASCECYAVIRGHFIRLGL